MIWLLARRNLTLAPWRTVFLLFGFSLMMMMRWQLAYPGKPIPFGVGGVLEKIFGQAANGGVVSGDLYNMFGAMQFSQLAVKNGVTPESHNYSGEGARLPALKGIMAAKKKPMAQAKLADYGAASPPAIKELSVTLPPPRAAGQIVPDIATLVKKLAEEAKVL